MTPLEMRSFSRADAITRMSEGDVTFHPFPVVFRNKLLAIAFLNEPGFMNLHLHSLSFPPSLAAQELGEYWDSMEAEREDKELQARQTSKLWW